MPSLTLEDVAKRAGVSRSTVSRVVNGYENVSQDVRQRVLWVIKETGYRPNAAARTLASQRSQMIGLILPFSVSSLFTDPYYPYLLKGISHACNQNNYTLDFFLFSSKEDEKKNLSRISNRGLLDGVLVQSDHNGDQRITNHLLAVNIPQVVIGRPMEPEKVSYVDVNNVSGSYHAVSHLARIGYQKISTITGPYKNTAGIDRIEGYLKAIKEFGLDVNSKLIVEGGFTEQGGYNAMHKLLPEHPDAVFAASDMMAIGAIRAINEFGLRIPEDIAVVGFDDIPIRTPSDIELTTVHQPVIQLGEKAVELLLDQIDNGAYHARSIILDTELIIRDSCGSTKRIANAP